MGVLCKSSPYLPQKQSCVSLISRYHHQTLQNGTNSDSGTATKPASFPGIEQFKVDPDTLYPVIAEWNTFGGVFAITAEAPDSALLAHRALRRLRQIERNYTRGRMNRPNPRARSYETLDLYQAELFKLVRTMRNGCSTEQLLESAAGMTGPLGAAIADEIVMRASEGLLTSQQLCRAASTLPPHRASQLWLGASALQESGRLEPPDAVRLLSSLTRFARGADAILDIAEGVIVGRERELEMRHVASALQGLATSGRMAHRLMHSLALSFELNVLSLNLRGGSAMRLPKHIEQQHIDKSLQTCSDRKRRMQSEIQLRYSVQSFTQMKYTDNCTRRALRKHCNNMTSDLKQIQIPTSGLPARIDTYSMALDRYINRSNRVGTADPAKKEVGVLVAADMLRHCETTRVRDTIVLEACADTFIANSKSILPSQLRWFLTSYGNLNYTPSKPAYEEAALRCLEQYFLLSPASDVLASLLALCYRGRCPPRLAEKAFTPKFIDGLQLPNCRPWSSVLTDLKLLDDTMTLEFNTKYPGPILGSYNKDLKPRLNLKRNETNDTRIRQLLSRASDELEKAAGHGKSRVIKSEAELEVLRYITRVSSEAHKRVMIAAKPGVMEYVAEAEFIRHCYGEGGCRQVSYTNICGSGCNGAVLHYGHAGAPNDKEIKDGDMCLFDMGGNYCGYAADITCSFPANGVFTPDQRLIYNAVLAANTAVQQQAKDGVSWVDMHQLSNRTLLGSLKCGGLLKGDIDEMMKQNLAAIFQPHGLGHLIGLDVHDCGGYLEHCPPRPPPGGNDCKLRTARMLKTGMCITVEPGCYFIDPLLDAALADPCKSRFLVPEVIKRFRGFGGVRIEDDIIITERGCENMTDVPRSVKDIEDWIAQGRSKC